ncbi:oxygen-dependent tRNA uridine(34) hydroxylase TrhO [Timonella senegalensis]|uniref:oxygen-dependent tRNA uridine(34) hydroxylase TrhO n=1 Tax=Timonella senegalensis TaxID=1465825 RepID=UPI0002F2D5D2|nr:rhodanese-related sulfurtransferase [Timonella senegalensis]
MAVNKIILFYAFAPVADPVAVKLWQRSLGEQWDLKGRVIVSPHGINATLGGTVENLKRYVKATKQYPGFGKMDVKWSEGTGDDFPRLSVKDRPELVAFGTPDEVKVDSKGVIGGGTHLSPEEVNKLVEEHGDDVVFFDGRNAFEAAIGRFDGAIIPDVQTTHGFIADIESGKYDSIKGKKIISYCTGGVRCEILSVLMKNRGFEDVYQIEGGIVRYGEKFGTKGLWKGPLHVFDKRMLINFDEDSQTLGSCSECGQSTDRFLNCADPGCKVLRLYCTDCEHIAAEKVCADCEDRLAAV